MIAELLGLVCKVIWINANAVPAHKPRPEPKGVPLGIHAVHNLIGVDPHAIEYHSQLVHKRDVDVALTVLNNLYRFGRLDAAHGIGAGLDNEIVDFFDRLQRFDIHTRNDFPDLRKRVYLVTGVYAFR